MTTKRAGLPEFWATGLAKLLVGDQPCQFEAWIKGHYRLEKSRRDDRRLTEWLAAHTEQLQAATAKARADGWRCQVEQYFRVQGASGILVGKTDLVLQHADRAAVVCDIKSGAPKDRDAAQVMIYMIALPLAWKVPTMPFEGRVVYPTHTVEVASADAQALKPRLFALLQRLGSPDRPAASPSVSACRWCDVSATDCPDRVDAPAESVDVLTSEW